MLQVRPRHRPLVPHRPDARAPLLHGHLRARRTRLPGRGLHPLAEAHAGARVLQPVHRKVEDIRIHARAQVKKTFALHLLNYYLFKSRPLLIYCKSRFQISDGLRRPGRPSLRRWRHQQTKRSEWGVESSSLHCYALSLSLIRTERQGALSDKWNLPPQT